jgi:hypothetical protein
MGKGIFHIAVLAGEAPGRTGTIQDRIEIWTTHQPVKNEPAVSFSTPQEDISCKEVGDLILPGIQG